ncbi:unnamed protein product [Gongylonema pulchrum]|uniref:CYTOSOL_AP domain-containing protein n=1 Tax=Gongylonema pulchrum TaxID=637853 RepID=A0A183D014_9BILA|nr:unnamed protein product [Gongylonema pulchrum]
MAALAVKHGIDTKYQLSRDTQVLFVGKKKHLKNVQFEGDIVTKLSGIVDAKTWNLVSQAISANGSGAIPLHLNLATVISVADDTSRHNAPSNSSAIFKELKSISQPDGVKNISIILYASLSDVFPSVAAMARCFPLYNRSTKSSGKLENVQIEVVVAEGEQLTDRDLLFLQTLAESIRNTARLIDMPYNELNTEQFTAEAIKLTADLPNMENIIIKGKDLLTQGFGGIYHVGKASTAPPVFACFSYKPPGATQTYAMVGKGIVYDTGGMQIKTKTGMPGMKNDMGGAAALLSSFCVLVKMGFKQNLSCLLCIADNVISPIAK